MNRLAIDIGARFVDMVFWDPSGMAGHKLPVGSGPCGDVLEGLARHGVEPKDLAEVRIASTGFLNALHDAQRGQTGPKVGLVTTAGFESVAVLGRQDRVGLFDPVARVATPEHLIAPGAICGVTARMDADGTELRPIDNAEVQRIACHLSGQGVSAVAICLLHAHIDGRHERAIADALRAHCPNLVISQSHVVDPEPREFERTVSTVLDAWLRVAVLPDLSALRSGLVDAGFAGRFAWGDGRGVLTDDHRAIVSMIAGGPAASIRAAATVAEGDAIAVDIGSRTTDLALIRGGSPALVESGLVAGVPVRGARVDLESLPIGGGVLLPGDAPFTLDEVLIAVGAMEGETSCPPKKAAGLLDQTCQHLAVAVTRHAARRNVDPTRANLVVTGGAGVLLAVGIANALGVARVTLPSLPALAGAIGLSRAPRRREITQRTQVPLRDLDPDTLTGFVREATVAFGASSDVAPPKLFARIAPRPRMPEIEVAIDPKAPGEVAAVYDSVYRHRYGIPPQGAGLVTSICARSDDSSGSADFCTAPPAGTAPVTPKGWTAESLGGGTRFVRGVV